ncbi:hypothetical protein MHU86_18639 [Fragilaria crotonensis]|nr:hypothetical protein MHU86_18639 [Fragilaria crotonensis]
MPRPPNPRRTTLGPVSMNRSSSGGGSGNGSLAGPLASSAMTPSKVPKPRKARQSMLPRMGRENTGTAGSTTSNTYPSSPSNSVVSVSSYSRRSIGGNHNSSSRSMLPGRQSLGGNNNSANGSVVKLILDPFKIRPINSIVFVRYSCS